MINILLLIGFWSTGVSWLVFHPDNPAEEATCPVKPCQTAMSQLNALSSSTENKADIAGFAQHNRGNTAFGDNILGMPVFKPDTSLTNSMPQFNPPPVDPGIFAGIGSFRELPKKP